MRCKPSHALDLQEIAEPIHQRSEAGALLDIGHAGEGLGRLINTLDREQRARRNLWDRQQKQGDQIDLAAAMTLQNERQLSLRDIL